MKIEDINKFTSGSYKSLCTYKNECVISLNKIPTALKTNCLDMSCKESDASENCTSCIASGGFGKDCSCFTFIEKIQP